MFSCWQCLRRKASMLHRKEKTLKDTITLTLMSHNSLCNVFKANKVALTFTWFQDAETNKMAPKLNRNSINSILIFIHGCNFVRVSVQQPNKSAVCNENATGVAVERRYVWLGWIYPAPLSRAVLAKAAFPMNESVLRWKLAQWEREGWKKRKDNRKKNPGRICFGRG